MNELRLKYQYETGININEKIPYRYYGEEREHRAIIEEYIEWLEQQLTDCNAVQEINNLINGRKNKTIFYSPDK